MFEFLVKEEAYTLLSWKNFCWPMTASWIAIDRSSCLPKSLPV